MSLDSRLFRPSRSNSSSASSALVRVGVSRLGSDARCPWLGFIVRCERSRRSAAQARRRAAGQRVDHGAPRRRRCARRSAWPVVQAAPGARPCCVRRRRCPPPACLGGRRRTAAPTAPGRAVVRAARCHQLRRGVTLSATTTAMSRCDRLVSRHRRELRQRALQHGIQVEFEQHRRMRQLVGLAPARVQFADDADAAAVELDARAAARVQRRMLVGTKLQRARRQQGFDVALDVEEVDARAPCRPHCRLSASP